jgi:hypothetical protein
VRHIRRRATIRASTALSAVFALAGGGFLLIALVLDWSPGESLLRPALLMAAYCFGWVILLGTARQSFVPVLLVAGTAVWLAYVQRALILMIDPTRFAFQTIVPLSEPTLTNSIHVLVLGTASILAGVWIVLRKVDVVSDTRRALRQMAPHRGALLMAALVSGVISLYLRFALSVVPTGASLATFLFRLASLEALLSLLAFMFASSEIKPKLGERRLFQVLIGIVFVAGFASGKRSAFLILILIFGIAVIWRNGNPRLSLPGLFIGAATVLVIFPLFLGLVSPVRDALYAGESVASSLRTDSSTGETGLVDATLVISDRLAGLDALVAVRGYEINRLDQYLNLRGFVRSFATSVLPDGLLTTTGPPLGKLFAVVFQGHDWRLLHHGAWSGFGVSIAYGGGITSAAALLLVWGALCGTLLRSFARAPTFAGLVPYTAQTFLFIFVVSGNIDTILGVYLGDVMVITGFILLIRVASPISRRIKFARPWERDTPASKGPERRISANVGWMP